MDKSKVALGYSLKPFFTYLTLIGQKLDENTLDSAVFNHNLKSYLYAVIHLFLLYLKLKIYMVLNIPK